MSLRPSAHEAEIAALLEGMRRRFETMAEERERAYILLGVLNFARFRPVPKWALDAWRTDLIKKIGQLKRGESQKRQYRAALVQEAAKLYRERRAENTGEPSEQSIEAVRAAMGPAAPSFETIQNAVRRSHKPRVKHRK